jgi:hypothetical protein
MRGTTVQMTRLPTRQYLLGSASLICLALLLAEPAQAQDPAGRPAFLDRFHFSIEGSLLFNRSDTNLSFDPTTTALNTLPASRPGKDGGSLGISFGAAFNPSWDWRLGWQGTWLQTNEQRTAPPIGFLSTPVPTQSSNSLWYQTFDAEFGYRMPTAVGALRLFVGPRVLNATSKMNYGYDDAPDKLGSFDNDVSLWGVGPRGGFEATVPLAASPAFLSLSGSASAIFARVEHSYAFNSDPNDGLGPFVGGANFDGSRTIYNLEGSAALGYRFNNMTALQVGYRMQHWSNLATSVRLLNDQGALAVGSSDVLVHGPFARFTVSLP